MHFRRLACFLLGAWLAGGLFMAMVATQNFRSVDRLLAHPAPAAAEQVRTLGHDSARAFLRYQVSEQNRWYFEVWEGIQLGLGAVLFFVLLFGSSEKTFTLVLALLMLAIAGVQRILLSPEITSLGRGIDFLPPGATSPDRTRFWTLHSVYSAVEVIKWALGMVLAVRLLLRSRRASGHARSEVDVVDKADYGRIDR